MPAKKKSALARSKARNGIKYQLHVAKKKSAAKKKFTQKSTVRKVSFVDPWSKKKLSGYQVYVSSPVAKGGWVPQGQVRSTKAIATKDAKKFGPLERAATRKK